MNGYNFKYNQFSSVTDNEISQLSHFNTQGPGKVYFRKFMNTHKCLKYITEVYANNIDVFPEFSK